MKKQGKRAVDNLFDFLEIIVMAMFVVVLVFTFVFRTVNVQGQSMQDTLFENDSLVISKLLYTPKQGDIVVVNSSVLDNRIIKRIIAVEGQKVEIDNKSAIVKVNGAVLDESYIKCDGSFDDEYFDERYYNKESEVYEYEVPAGCCFVMGDNRNHSTDSRDIGPIPKEKIQAKVMHNLTKEYHITTVHLKWFKRIVIIAAAFYIIFTILGSFLFPLFHRSEEGEEDTNQSETPDQTK